MRTVPTKLRAHAKLNLGLKIKGVIPNGPFKGYHRIESLFVPITIYDEIEIEEASDSSDQIVYQNSSKQLSVENDIIAKTLDLYRKTIRSVPALRIQVSKKIPIGAGLGGGSSDAAAVLIFLARHYAPPQSDQSPWMLSLALQLGADVPFFLQLKPALVSGVGENVAPTTIPPLFFVVVSPDFRVNTKMAYGWYDEHCELTPLGRDATPRGHSDISGYSLKMGEPQTASEILGNLSNDFEKPVEKRFPEIIMMKTALRTRGALGTLMSGTGSSVYGIFRSLDEAVAARDHLQENLPSQYTIVNCETLRAN